MEHSVVVCRAAEYTPAVCEQAVERVFAALAAPGRIGPDTRILLKPNLLARHAPDHAVTTHPEILRAVIHACVRRGARPENITVADSPGGLYNAARMEAMYKTTGLAAVCAAEGVQAYTACESGVRRVENGVLVHEFELIRPVLEADFIIDLPKMKTHVMTGMTAACKNLFGCIPGLQKAEWHTRFPEKERFGQMLTDLLLAVQPDMAVLDAVVGLEGDGPAGGEPRPVGLVLGGEDLPLLDQAVCSLMGLEPMRVPYLKAAVGRGLVSERFDPAVLCGDADAFAPVKDWKLPSSYQGGGSGSTDFALSSMPAFLAPAAQWAERRIAPHPVVDRKKCIGCGRCAEICPRHTIAVSGGRARIGAKDCIRCFCCHEMCPAKAIEVRKLPIFRL